jgi:hypothetical protein
MSGQMFCEDPAFNIGGTAGSEVDDDVECLALVERFFGAE